MFGGGFYFLFAFVPMFIAFSSTVIDPAYVELFQQDDARKVQQILPTLILEKTPIWCQVLFFGALLSAILSTASGTLLAPASVITENVLQPLTGRFSDWQMLWLLRSILVLVAILATTFSVNSESTMYEMVESGYKVTLVVAFIPLVFGIYWKRASTQGAVFAILLSVPVWIGMEFLYDEESTQLWKSVPPQLYGLAASFVGMIIGSSMPNWIQHREADPEALAARRQTPIGH
jgi:Na+/proline symporter